MESPTLTQRRLPRRRKPQRLASIVSIALRALALAYLLGLVVAIVVYT